MKIIYTIKQLVFAEIVLPPFVICHCFRLHFCFNGQFTWCIGEIYRFVYAKPYFLQVFPSRHVSRHEFTSTDILQILVAFFETSARRSQSTTLHCMIRKLKMSFIKSETSPERSLPVSSFHNNSTSILLDDRLERTRDSLMSPPNACINLME